MAGRKSTQKPLGNTKLEPSEIFAAVGMMMKEMNIAQKVLKKPKRKRK